LYPVYSSFIGKNSIIFWYIFSGINFFPILFSCFNWADDLALLDYPSEAKGKKERMFFA